MSSKIISNYLPELRSITAGRKHPAVVSLNITEKCNQKCVYCEIGNNIPSSTAEALNTGDLKWLIDEMHRIGIKRLAINGGEPFLFPDLIETVKYAAEKNIICAITSNGMTIHKLSDTEIQILKDSKTEINISVDSMDDNIQSLTRGVGSALTNALKSAELLIKAGIPVIFLTAISVYNYKDLFRSFLKIYESGINQVLYQPIIYYSNYPDRQTIKNKFNLNVEEENIAELMFQLRQILKFERTHNIKTNVYRIMPWIEHYLHTASGNGKTWFWEKCA